MYVYIFWCLKKELVYFSYVICNHVSRLGHFAAACSVYGAMLRFFTVNHKEVSRLYLPYCSSLAIFVCLFVCLFVRPFNS